MHPGHITISALMLLSAAGLLAGLHYQQPGLVALGTMAGWLFSVVAIVVGFVVIVLIAVRAYSGKAMPLLRQSWLGVLNGFAAILVFWLAVSGAT